MNRQQLARLVRNYQQHLSVTGGSLSATATQAWDELGSWNEPDIEAFTTAVTPAADAALSNAQSLAAGFVALAAQLDIGTLPEIGAPAAPNWPSAFQTLWAGLANGRPWDQSFGAGRSVIDAVSVNSVHDAARQTTTAIDRSEPRLTRWERIPDGNACDWCLTVADQTYSTADSADFGHDRCGCSVVPA